MCKLHRKPFCHRATLCDTFTFARPNQRLRSCKGHGWHNSTNQSGLGRAVHKRSQRWTTRKLRVQHATSCHCGRTLQKNLSKCHPNVLMDGHVSCEVNKQNSTPNWSEDSRKRCVIETCYFDAVVSPKAAYVLGHRTMYKTDRQNLMSFSGSCFVALLGLLQGRIRPVHGITVCMIGMVESMNLWPFMASSPCVQQQSGVRTPYSFQGKSSVPQTLHAVVASWSWMRL